MTEKKRVISILVDNESGALNRIVNLFNARGYNIESLAVAVVDKKNNISRIIITSFAGSDFTALIVKLLNRLIPVHKAEDLTDKKPVIQAMALVKINYEGEKDEIIKIGEDYNAKIVNFDDSKKIIIFNIVEDSKNINRFIDKLENLGKLDISRAGSIALSTE